MSQGTLPGDLTEAEFIARFAAVYEESSWVARIAWWENEADILNDVEALAAVMRTVVNRAPEDIKLALLRAHPDLAGRAALASELSDASTREQSGAGLSQCSPEELQAFQDLNDAYRDKFRFPFIIAVTGLGRTQILQSFRQRLCNDREREFDTAINEVHKIAGIRLRSDFETSPMRAGEQ